MKYIDDLVEQFIKANGITKYNYSREFLREFSDWVQERQKQSKDYVYLLKQMGIDISNYSTAEIGKTSFDSIGRNYYTTLITPYVYGFEQRNNLIESQFNVDSEGQIYPNSSNLFYIKQYMTFNPYNEQCIKNWDILHNNNFNIIVGVFGKETDKDFQEKIEQLEKFKLLLVNNYAHEETTINGTYCKVIASRKK